MASLNEEPATTTMGTRAVLDTFVEHARLGRLVLREAASLRALYEAKRAQVHTRFASLIRRDLDEAVVEGSIAALDTRVTTLVWLGAVNEIVIRSAHRHPGSRGERTRPDPPASALHRDPTDLTR